MLQSLLYIIHDLMCMHTVYGIVTESVCIWVQCMDSRDLKAIIETYMYVHNVHMQSRVSIATIGILFLPCMYKPSATTP